jgi:hypothetical protein
MQTFGHILKVIGCFLALGPIIYLGVSYFIVLYGPRSLGEPLVNAAVAAILVIVAAVPTGLCLLMIGFAIAGAKTESKLGRRLFP